MRTIFSPGVTYQLALQIFHRNHQAWHHPSGREGVRQTAARSTVNPGLVSRPWFADLRLSRFVRGLQKCAINS
jgi:hypothetical protein